MHFLKKSETEHLDRAVGKPRAAVYVKVDGTKLVVTPNDKGEMITVCKMDTLFVPLPERFKVVGLDGKVVKTSKGSRFWVTVESIDPFHLVIDAKDLPL